MGAEAGQSASEQDRANWAERVSERRMLFAEPQVLRPLCRALQRMHLLPKDEASLDVKWPSAFIMSPLEAAMVMAQKARAIGNISRQTGNKRPMQLTSRAEGRELLGLEGDLTEKDLFEIEDVLDVNKQQQQNTPKEPEEGAEEDDAGTQ